MFDDTPVDVPDDEFVNEPIETSETASASESSDAEAIDVIDPPQPLAPWDAIQASWFAIALGVLLVGLSSHSIEYWILFAPFVPVPFIMILMRNGFRAIPFALGVSTVVGINVSLSAYHGSTGATAIVAGVNAIIIPIIGTRVLFECCEGRRLAKIPLLAMSVVWAIAVFGLGAATIVESGIAGPVQKVDREFKRVVDSACSKSRQSKINFESLRTSNKRACERYEVALKKAHTMGYRLAIPLGLLVAIAAAGTTLLCARWFSARSGLALKRSKPLALFTAHWLTAYVAAAGFIILMAGHTYHAASHWLDGIGWGLVTIATVAFGMQGAATVAFSMHAKKVRPGLRLAFWAIVVASISSLVPVIGLATIGAIESVLHLRQRILSRIERPD